MMIEREHTSIRLRQAMEEKGMRQVDLLEAVKPYCKRYGVNISKGQLSQYLSGRNEPGQMRIFILALALDVSEAWLMGLDYPKERQAPASTADGRREEFERLFSNFSPEQQELILQAMRGIAAGK
jgi:transcriptional regulator with XRE-family HTH domain